jgi:diguanylate cyclase (GGDEF)-like protein/PAS domain S-box-containing protein
LEGVVADTPDGASEGGHIVDEASLEEVARAVLGSHSALLLVVDAAGRIAGVNRAVERLSGWHNDELLGREWFNVFLPAADVEAARTLFLRAVRNEVDLKTLRRHVDHRWVTRSGEVRDTAWSSTIVRGIDGTVALVIATGVDITEQRAADTRLRQCLDVMVEGVCLLDAVRDKAGNIVDFAGRYLNPAGRDVIRRLRPGRGVRHAFSPGGTWRLFPAFARVVEDGAPFNERVEVQGTDPPLSLEVSAARLGDGLVVTFRDVTALRHTEERLAFLATHDPLTGLANRPLLVDRLEHALARRQGALAVVFMDLDGFKAVNDRHGHQVGDETLVRVARAMEGAVRPADTVARFGGDEFVVVADDLATADAESLAKRITAAVGEVSVGPLRLEASVGVATAEPDDTAEALLRRADAAMYADKHRP